MKKYAKLIQADKRGQIVIPKDVRSELDIDETTGFYVYTIPGEGILLKKITQEPLDGAIDNLKKHAEKLGVSEQALRATIEDYKKTGGLQEL